VKLLALDTSSGQCSAALLLAGQLQFRAVLTAREHARLLLPLVDELLAEAGLGLSALDGIAFGRGPGSFTGVRIAAAVTQGLAAGAGLPVLPVSSLRALARQARERVLASTGSLPPGVLLACMDARMNEVYWGSYGHGLEEGGEGEEAVGPVSALLTIPLPVVAAAAGKGLAAWPDIAVSLQLPPTHAFAEAEPHASDVAWLAAQDLARGARWLDAALAQPVYLRDQVAHPRKVAGSPAL
jgi:tRNA threonylcarbamoyladenosine biosynthesis protein TsaB